jgi:hypothetical protein
VTAANTLAMALTGLLGWIGVLVSLAGLAVSLYNLGLSRWTPLLAGGFGLQMVLGLFHRVWPFVAQRGLGFGYTPSVFVVTTLLSVVAGSLIVAGVAGLLSELKSRG